MLCGREADAFRGFARSRFAGADLELARQVLARQGDLELARRVLCGREADAFRGFARSRFAGADLELARQVLVPEVEVCALEDLPPGASRVVAAGPEGIGVYNCGGELFAIEDRCTHDDGKLCEGEWEPETCEVICPRHGARFDVRTGQALTLPAYLPVAAYPVRVRDDGMIVVEVP